MSRLSPNQDGFRSEAEGGQSFLLDQPQGADNRVIRQSTCFGITGEVGVTRKCKGCDRRFVPTGPQVYCSHECYSQTLRGPIEPRFWAKVNRNGPIPAHMPHLGPCWLWTASKFGCWGHGQFTYRREGAKQAHVYAHRYSWELTNGPIPSGLSCLHKCDVPLCVRPEHLFLGTQADNLADAHAKGRLIDGLGARKLSDAAYEEILTSTDTGLALAAKFGVTPVTISRIRHGRQGSSFHRSRLRPVTHKAS